MWSSRTSVPPTCDHLLVSKVIVYAPVGVYGLPQHRVVWVQPDRRTCLVGERGCGVDVVVVSVRADDRLDSATSDCGDDWSMVVCRVDHNDLSIVAHQPNVVLDLEVLTIE